MEIGDQKWNIIALNEHTTKGHTGTGFLLKMIKFSARPVKNLVNLCAKIRSISSACLILILIRIELMDGSMRTCSFSLRAICSGFKTISEEVLSSAGLLWIQICTWPRLPGYYVVQQFDWRSFRDITLLSSLLGRSLDMAAVYLTTN